MNLKPGWLFRAQNQGTRGSEIRNPPRAKIFAITRTAYLFSRGTNSRRMAPASGVKSTMERMWLYISSVLSSQLPVLSNTKSLGYVVNDKSQQPGHHDQRIPLHQSPLDQAHGIRHEARQNRGTIDENAIDDPGSSEPRKSADGARRPAGAVHGAVDHLGVECG